MHYCMAEAVEETPLAAPVPLMALCILSCAWLAALSMALPALLIISPAVEAASLTASPKEEGALSWFPQPAIAPTIKMAAAAIAKSTFVYEALWG